MTLKKLKVSGANAPSTEEEKRIVTRFAFMQSLGVTDEMMSEDVTLDAYQQFITMYQDSVWNTFEAINDCRLVSVSGFGKAEIKETGIVTGFFTDAFIIDGDDNVANVVVNEEETITFKMKDSE